MTTQLKTDTVPVNQTLLHQAIGYLKQYKDPMAKMLLDQFQFALCQEKERREEEDAIAARKS
jgi:hypothetical protein